MKLLQIQCKSCILVAEKIMQQNENERREGFNHE